jgi:hypothetical protein
MAKLPQDAFQVLGEMIRPPPPAAPTKAKDFMPSLTPAQTKLFFDEARYILSWSEKGSGKTVGSLHKLVKHCYDNRNALALILVRVKSMANKGGAWDKLQSWVLPEWQQGLGLNYSEVKMDPQHNEFIWIQNQHGGWSMVVVISAPHANQLRDRIRGYEPSFVFADEMTSMDSDIYFTSVAAQIGRRPFVDDVQQFVGACNPEGPTHWVYKKWFEEAFNDETGEWDPDFSNIYFPVDENRNNLTPGYLESLEKIYRNDETERSRMVSGEWVDKPSGDGIFRDIYNPVIHMRPVDEEGKPKKSERILPDPNHPIIIGLDPGSVNNAFIFEQYMMVEGEMRWVIFDELVTLRKRINYPDFIPMVMRRVKFWRERVNGTPQRMQQIWISDNSAFNQFRAAQGSYDVLEIEKIYEANRQKYNLEPLGKIKQCPKPAGSVVARVNLGQQMLNQDKVIVSAGCPRVHQMFLQLVSKGQKAGEPFDPEAAMTPKKPSDHGHTWDATSYPWLMAALMPTALIPARTSTQFLAGVRTEAA